MYKACISVAFVSVLLSLTLCSANAQQKDISSPDGKISVTVKPDSKLNMVVHLNHKPAFTISHASLVIRDHETGKINSIKSRSVNQVQHPLIREKRATVTDKFNELTVTYKSKSGFVLRVYDDGIAYRYFTRFNEDSVVVLNETASIQFAGGDSLYVPLIRCREDKGVDCFHTSFEDDFVQRAVSQLSTDQLAYLPIYARTGNGISMSMTESDLYDYPGMYITGNQITPNSLNMRFPAYPLNVSVFGDLFKQELVT